MQPDNVAPTPRSTQWSQSILKISMVTHGYLYDPPPFFPPPLPRRFHDYALPLEEVAPLEDAAYIYVAICVWELYLPACSKQGS